MIRASEVKEAKKWSCGDSIVSSELYLAKVYSYLLENIMMVDDTKCFYEDEEVYLQETISAKYVVETLVDLGYKVELYTRLDKYNNRDSGIIIGWE